LLLLFDTISIKELVDANELFGLENIKLAKLVKGISL
jgi:hypothetical protein